MSRLAVVDQSVPVKIYPLSIGMTPAFFDEDHMLLRAQLNCLNKQTFKDFDVWLIDPHYQKRKAIVPELAQKYRLNVVHLPYTPNTRVAKWLDCAVFNAIYCYSRAERIARFSCYRIVRPGWTAAMMSAPANVNVDFYASNIKPDCPAVAHIATDHNTKIWNFDTDEVNWEAVPRSSNEPGAAWTALADADRAATTTPPNCTGNVMWWREQWLTLNGTDEVFTNTEHYEDINFCHRSINAKQLAMRKAKLLYRLHHRYGRHDGRSNAVFDTPFLKPCKSCLNVVAARKHPMEDRFDLMNRVAKREVALFENQNVWVCNTCRLSGSIWYRNIREHVEFLKRNKTIHASIVPEVKIGRNLRVPDQILIAFVAELKLYEICGGKGMFPELLCILEESGATGPL